MMDRDRPTLAEALDPEEAPRLRPTTTLDDFVLDEHDAPREVVVEQTRPKPQAGSLGGRWLRWALGMLPVLAAVFRGAS